VALSVKLFPDAELLLINWLPVPLAAALAQIGINAEPQVTMDLPLPAPGAAFPLIVRVTKIAGKNISRFVDRPIVDLDVFGPVFDDVATTARVIQNLLLFSLTGQTTPDGTVSLITTSNGPRWLPDVNQNLTRYSATYEIHTH
jgi:hypothetical protein